MLRTIRAIELKPEDFIIGDRTYAAGTLSYEVVSVSAKYPAVEGEALVTAKILSGHGKHQIERTIAWGGSEKLILGTNDRDRGLWT
jgi:hypothetical protein